jgi:hypothetical protein
VLQISATVHMALVQGIYDLGEPGREAKRIEFKRLPMIDQALHLNSRQTQRDTRTRRKPAYYISYC